MPGTPRHQHPRSSHVGQRTDGDRRAATRFLAGAARVGRRSSVVVRLLDQLGHVVLLAELREQPDLGLQVVDVLFLVAEDRLEDVGAGHIAHAAHVLDAAPQAFDRLGLDRQIRLEHLADRLADAQREQALEVGQPVEEQDPVRQGLGVPHLVDRLGPGVPGELHPPEVLLHLVVQEVLVDGRELGCQLFVKELEYPIVSAHTQHPNDL